MRLSAAEAAAQAALRARQGKGARWDAPGAPGDDLLLARRGIAFFARKLAQLPDKGLREAAGDAPTRAHVVVELGYAARKQALSLDALMNGGPVEGALALPSVALAATLPPHALRHLFHHAHAHLNVCWRDLSDAQWDETMPGGCDPAVARALPRAHAKRLWQGVVRLGVGVGTTDLPADVRPRS